MAREQQLHPSLGQRTQGRDQRGSAEGLAAITSGGSGLALNPHISRGEICAVSKFLLERNLARPTGKNGKTKVVVPFFRRG
jgi:hypothetical protein